jgi:hypothetical protein
MRKSLLAAASVAALGLAFTSAQAASPTGYVDGGYAYTNTNTSGSDHINDWNVKGAVNMPFGASAFSGQLEGSYNGLNEPGGSDAHVDNGAISVMWTNPMVRVGATAAADEIGGGGPSEHFNTYGGFVNWYATPAITAGAKGASVTCSGCSSASVWGGRLMGYPMPNVALNLDYDTFRASSGGAHIDTWSGGAEWQPTAQPWTVRFGYSNTQEGGETLNTYNLNFRWYFGGNGTLVQHHRGGVEPWGTQVNPFRFLLGTP